MTLNILLGALFLVGVTLIQTTWIEAVRLFGVLPDLGVLTAVWLAYRRGPVIGTSASFLAGFVDDVLSAAPLGYNAFVKTTVAWVSSLFHGVVELDRVFLPLLFGAGATLLKAAAAGLLALLFSHTLPAYDFLARRLWLEMAYTALAAPLYFGLLDGAVHLLARRRPETP